MFSSALVSLLVSRIFTKFGGEVARGLRKKPFQKILSVWVLLKL